MNNIKQKKLSIQQGFSYVEVLVATFILAVAIVPAMEALQSGIQGAAVHESLTQQHSAITTKMENMLSEPYASLLSAAQAAGNANTPSSYSDPAGSADRVLVFVALYDADADPFTLIDPNNDGDSNIYTGDSSNLLWLRVAVEGTEQSLQSLVSR